MTLPRILQKTESFVVHYPEAEKFIEDQFKVIWFADEIKVEKDVQDILTNLTEAEKHGVITTLKLFTLYELKAGADYWTGRFMRTFKRPELQSMGSVFGAFELGIHKTFYNAINEALHLNTDEFYNSYVDDPILKERMEFINSVVIHKNPLVSIGVFSLIEGAVLYSSFAFLKHFQQSGKNKITNIGRGINMSVRDENIHSEAGAWVYRTLKQEQEQLWGISEEVEQLLVEAAHKIYEHECHIVKKIFEKGRIEGITETQMIRFVESRINLCLKNLGIKPLFKVEYNPIADWFYSGINTFNFNDHFSGMGREYTRNWDEQAFVWKIKEHAE